jgi:hypothetical protein
MSVSSAHVHVDNRPDVIIYDRSQSDSSWDDDSSELTSPSTARLETTEKGQIHERTTTLKSKLHAHTNRWKEHYGYLTEEGKKCWVTPSLLDDDDDNDDNDDFLGNNDKYKSSEGCAAQALETCVLCSIPVLHFLNYFIC